MSENEYSYDKSLAELESIVSRVVADKNLLSEFTRIIENARERKTVPIRGIQKKLMNYRKENSNTVPFTERERKVMREIMEYWG